MSIESIVRTCNKQAMEHLCASNYTECFRLLKKAEEIVNSPNYPTSSKLHAVTLNNLGCYYKRINSNGVALEYLKRALEEEKDTDGATAAGTHLNMLAVLSQQNNHEDALYHGIQALRLLKDEQNINTLAIALQSTGDEYAAVGNIVKALATYKYGLELCQEHFGAEHPYTMGLYERYHSLGQPEKKFYFEKLNKRTTKQIFKNFRNYSILPTINAPINGPIKPSKSFEKSPNQKYRVNRKVKSVRGHMSTAPNKHKTPQQLAQKSRSNQGRMYTVDDTYMKLEEKINSLQNQLEVFEHKYKKLENFAKSKIPQKRNRRIKKTPEECAIVIQKFWRGYQDRKQFRVYKRKMTHERAKRAIEELEILRKEAINEDLYGEDVRPKTNIPEIYRKKIDAAVGSSYRLHRVSLYNY